jgi:hypothetical protein
LPKWGVPVVVMPVSTRVRVLEVMRKAKSEIENQRQKSA